ncbi:MAG TPA: hypothetical protein VJZ27_20145 [Aggregatilineales bacterium]|nr:hypothetical protein [Aggregatilineales bacterium]
MKDLPDFVPRSFDQVQVFIERVLTGHETPDETCLVNLIVYDDFHFRALFQKRYFNADPPSKSQWNTLKKKLKRFDRQVFVFKDHGEAGCESGEAPVSSPEQSCYYLDFGFLAPR